MRLLCFPRRKKPESNYKPLVNKTSGVRPVPPPPSRRPNIKERISMLEMAQINHDGFYVPENGIRIILPRDKKRVVPTHGFSFHGKGPTTVNAKRPYQVEAVQN